jgi:CobQ-like glutamine amidotransferase family enzyme
VIILEVLPHRLNVNGDSENARVLARRAGWSGVDATIVSAPDAEPDVIVVGSGYDSDLEAILAELVPFQPVFADAVARDVPILAVATGLALLSARLELEPGRWVDGLGVFPGSAPLAPERLQGDLVVDSPFGRLAGFENHARGYTGGDSLGAVLHGQGNGAGSGHEGVRSGSAIGTHLHGPVLALNPVLADHMLATASGGRYSAEAREFGEVDALAEQSRLNIARRVQDA